MVWTLLLLFYGILLTVIQVYDKRKRLHPFEIEIRRLNGSIKSIESTTDRVKIISALAELQKVTIPWYERSISMMGVVAFISMSVAIGIQTINANLQEVRSMRLESKLNDLSAEREAAEEFVTEVSRAVVSGILDIRSLGDVERRILRYRLDRLRKSSVVGIDKIREMYTLALALRDYEVAVSVLELNPGLLDSTVPGDRLSLAEYYYFVGAVQSSKDLQQQIWMQRQHLARPLAKRLAILRTAIGFNVDVEVEELVRVFGLRKDEARQMLSREVSEWDKAATVIKNSVEKKSD